jgi:hypothetical protein
VSALRGLVAVVGGLFAVASLGLLAMPDLAAAVPADAIVDALGNDYFFLAIFGGLALAMLAVAVGGRTVQGLNQATPPRPERVQPAPHFGADFDDAVSAGVGLRELWSSDRRETIRSRLREDAIRVAMGEGSSRTEAKRRVENGTWTEDPDAAAFLSPSTSPPIASRVRAGLHGKTWFQRGARRTAAVVVERSDPEGRR